MANPFQHKVEEVSCQLTYQDMATLNAIFSGWSSQLAANKRSSNDSALAVEGEDSGRRGRAPQEASDLGHDREDDLGGDNDAVQQVSSLARPQHRFVNVGFPHFCSSCSSFYQQGHVLCRGYWSPSVVGLKRSCLVHDDPAGKHLSERTWTYVRGHSIQCGSS